MNAFYIKLIAIITMVIDHVGVFLLPGVFELRMIGRLSFVLFAWLIANGAVHTKNSSLYLKRLILLSIISQIPFSLARRELIPNSLELNIFVTLSLGLAAIIILQKFKNLFIRLTGVVVMIFLAERFASGFSYGGYGVILMLIFYLFYKNLKKAFLLVGIATFYFYFRHVLQSGQSMEYFYNLHSISLIQPLALLSFIFIALYNGKEGPKAKLLFYLFYPAHLLIIYLLMLSNNL